MAADSPVLLAAAPEDGGKRLDHFLQERLPAHSRSRLQAWIRAGCVIVDGHAAKPSAELRGGEAVEVRPMAPPPLRAFAEDLPVEVLYEDPSVIVVNKPAGMVVHRGAGNHSGTLVNALLYRFGQLAAAGGEERPGIVHRLDRYTSGVLMVARTNAAHGALVRQFAARSVEKVYLTLVHGLPRPETGRIELPVERDRVRRTRMTARSGKGRAASTEYKVLRRFEKFSYLEVRIHTGRTHQIRVHLAAAGHPVAGDRLYGAPQTAGLERYFLHAHRLRFTSPASGTEVTVEAPLAADLEGFLAGLL